MANCLVGYVFEDHSTGLVTRPDSHKIVFRRSQTPPFSIAQNPSWNLLSFSPSFPANKVYVEGYNVYVSSRAVLRMVTQRLFALDWVVPKSYHPKGQPRSTRNEFPIRADFGNGRGQMEPSELADTKAKRRVWGKNVDLLKLQAKKWNLGRVGRVKLARRNHNWPLRRRWTWYDLA